MDPHRITGGGQGTDHRVSTPVPKQQPRRSGTTEIGQEGQALANRADAQTVLSYAVAQPALALEAASTEEGRQRALALYDSRTFAATTIKSRESTLRTWCRIHQQWFGVDVPVVPVDSSKLRAVVAALIVGRYRSCENYISRIKDHHIELGFPWSDLLAREYKRAVAAGQRGLGPAHQCLELELESAVTALCDHSICLTLPSGAPIGFENYVVVSSFFVLRENEASLMLASSVHIDIVNKYVEVNLPASKTDPRALSVVRRWGCTCGARHSFSLCPYCAAVKQMDLVHEVFADMNNCLPVDLPFFPTRTGEACDKHDVIDAIHVVAKATGQPVKQRDGRSAFGGHVFRISGARHLYRCGVDVATLKLLARWESNVVLRYIKDVPLETLHSKYMAGGSASSSSSGSSPNAFVSHQLVAAVSGNAMSNVGSMKFVQEQMLAIKQNAEAEAQSLSSLAEQLKLELSQTGKRSFGYIVNESGRGAVHICAVNPSTTHPKSWKTACGWMYAHADFSRMDSMSDFPEERLCHRCFGLKLLGDADL